MKFNPEYINTIGEGNELLYFIVGGAALIFAGSLVVRNMNEDRKLEVSKRHHPKGVGYTDINEQLRHMTKKQKKFVPDFGGKFYPFSPLKHGRRK